MASATRRPPRLFRSPTDQLEHARKAAPLGISAEEHAMLSFLVSKREIDLMSLRGLKGAALGERVRNTWMGAPVPTPAAANLDPIPMGPQPVERPPVAPGDTASEL